MLNIDAYLADASKVVKFVAQNPLYFNQQRVGRDHRPQSAVYLELNGGFGGERIFADVTTTTRYEQMQRRATRVANDI